MIIRLIIICLVFLAVLFVIAVIGEILYWRELSEDEKNAEKEEQEERSKQKRITMCLKTRNANACPGVCSKCAWGDNVYEFRER